MAGRNGDGLSTRAKRLLVIWAVCSAILMLAFVGYWIWSGSPRGPDGLAATMLEALVICILAPPVVYAIGKIAIG